MMVAYRSPAWITTLSLLRPAGPADARLAGRRAGRVGYRSVSGALGAGASRRRPPGPALQGPLRRLRARLPHLHDPGIRQPCRHLPGDRGAGPARLAGDRGGEQLRPRPLWPIEQCLGGAGPSPPTAPRRRRSPPRWTRMRKSASSSDDQGGRAGDGQPPQGLDRRTSETVRSPHLLAEAGYRWIGHWPNGDRPTG